MSPVALQSLGAYILAAAFIIHEGMEWRAVCWICIALLTSALEALAQLHRSKASTVSTKS